MILDKLDGDRRTDSARYSIGLPDRFFERAEEDLPQCDLLIVIGTSLKVSYTPSMVLIQMVLKST